METSATKRSAAKTVPLAQMMVRLASSNLGLDPPERRHLAKIGRDPATDAGAAGQSFLKPVSDHVPNASKKLGSVTK